jgi:hypothetical protein
MGPNYAVQLWAAPGADQPESELRPVFPIKTFGTTASTAGAIGFETVTLTNVPADYPVATVQIRVWETPLGFWIPTWWEAQNYHGIRLGKSPTFNVEAIGGGTNPPPNLINLRSFSLIQILLDTPVEPLIYVQPQHQTASPGGSVTFTAETSLPANKPVYWRFNGSNIVSGWGSSYQPLTNAFTFPMLPEAGGRLVLLTSPDFFFGFPQTNLLQVTNVQPAQAGIYSLVVTNDCCPLQKPDQKSFAISSNAILTVGNPGTLAAARDSHSQVVLNWDGVFFLQTATNATGPFTDLPGPIVFGPYTNSEANGSRFFRLRN